jgi:uncharacterized protein (DUF305 family)
MRTKWILTIAIASVLGTATAQGMGHAHGMAERHGAEEARPAGMHGVGMPGTGMRGMDMAVAFDDEAGFLQHMILHHREAVESAEALLEVAEREELRELAREVIEAQRAEIEMMEAWLEDWYPERTEEIAYEPMMRDLRGLSPDEAERAFLEGMIMHHMMAVRDARHLLAQELVQHDEVETMARAIIDDQMREIAQMQTWLREWFDAPAGGMMPGMGTMQPGMMGGSGMMEMGDVQMQRMHEMMHGMGMMGGHGMMHGPGMMRGHGMPHDPAAGFRGHHGMHPMMPACMQMMMGQMGQIEPMGQMGPMGPMAERMPMMGDAGVGVGGIGEAGIEALARAFLAGRGADAEIVDVEAPRNVYRITYRDGELEGVLLVDADTGEVTAEPESE